MTGRVATGHLSCIVNTPHVTVIIRHNCRLYRNNSLLWVGRECLSVGTRLPCPSTPQLSSHRWSPYSNVTMFQSQCLRFVVLGHTLSMQPHCSTTGIFFCAKSPNKSGEEKKLSMYSLWPNPSTSLVRLVTVAQVAVSCCAALCLYRGKHSCHMYIQ